VKHEGRARACVLVIVRRLRVLTRDLGGTKCAPRAQPLPCDREQWRALRAAEKQLGWRDTDIRPRRVLKLENREEELVGGSDLTFQCFDRTDHAFGSSVGLRVARGTDTMLTRAGPEERLKRVCTKRWATV
jgi:hypothetical protein